MARAADPSSRLYNLVAGHLIGLASGFIALVAAIGEPVRRVGARQRAF